MCQKALGEHREEHGPQFLTDPFSGITAVGFTPSYATVTSSGDALSRDRLLEMLDNAQKVAIDRGNMLFKANQRIFELKQELDKWDTERYRK